MGTIQSRGKQEQTKFLRLKVRFNMHLNPCKVMSNLLTIISILPYLVFADSNGMDMSMDGAMEMMTGNMLNYLHFTPGDNMWFLGWVPASAGAMVGTCIGLCLLGIVERLIAGVRGVSERHWEKRWVPRISVFDEGADR